MQLVFHSAVFKPSTSTITAPILMLKAKAAASPLVEILPQDPTKPIQFENVARFTVFAPPAAGDDKIPQYVHKDYVQPWLSLVGSLAQIGIPWIGAGSIVNSIRDMGGSSISNTIVGSGNTMKTAGTTNISGVVTNSTLGGLVENATATPTVVMQPAPVIVEQPAPIIVAP